MQPRPSGHTIDLQHEKRPVLRGYDIDAREIRTDGRGSGNRQTRQFGLVEPFDPLGSAALEDIGDPAFASAAHHRDCLAGADENAEIAEGRTRARDVMLKVIDAVDLLLGRQVGEGPDQPYAAALRAEERF